MANGDIPDPTLFSGFAPAMSPGQAGIGGFVAPTADDPQTSASQTGNAGAGWNWGGIATALQGAAKSMQDAQKDQPAVPQTPLVQGSSPAAPIGRPSAPVGLGNLVQLLQQRQQEYAQAAMNRTPAGALYTKQARPSTGGLLGY